MASGKEWPRVAMLAGWIAMLAGAVDPLEGSILIFLGGGLVALGTLRGQGDRRLAAYRVWTFALITAGVAAMWVMSAAGGIGGSTGRSMWWGVLILPYLAGWLMTVWGPGLPRWFSLLGLIVGLWYLAIPLLILARRPASGAGGRGEPGVAIGLGVVGLLTVAGCVRRLLVRQRQTPAPGS